MQSDNTELLKNLGPIGRILGGLFCAVVTAFLLRLSGYFIYLYRFEPRSLAPGAQYLFIFVVLLFLFMLRTTYLILKPQIKADGFSVFGGPRGLIIACWIMVAISVLTLSTALFNIMEDQSMASYKGIGACIIVIPILLKAIVNIKEKSLNRQRKD